MPKYHTSRRLWAMVEPEKYYEKTWHDRSRRMAELIWNKMQKGVPLTQAEILQNEQAVISWWQEDRHES